MTARIRFRASLYQNMEEDREIRIATALDQSGEESLTIQGAPDTDINELMHRYGVRDFSTIPAELGMPILPEYYGDFTDIPDLKTALDRMNDAKAKFAALPAKLRARFNNDLRELHFFLNDSDNLEEAIKLGLLTRETPKPGTIPESAPALTPPAPPFGGEPR